ncbi:uncharacterized protein MELLADRAFT_78798 [Melampsora larici-populina 98AG31]|uniref:Uncharacterized protein n=1 Tax=Melampsora larici-populina (strain 98AG31 / pathotype 3-4-7) TaxID=747676 RepID=F4RYX0_MELLP|nr:uncharacterized protein MELLADRAFT_78798 [Melampsora larici-populina 98AG31]EGG02322.1 hypothetical protein MELLADRAFT_78798 [Melampsora larici-populina 98AG31]
MNSIVDNIRIMTTKDASLDSFLDILALRLSSVPFNELTQQQQQHQPQVPDPINRSTTKPVTISFVGKLINPIQSFNSQWITFQSIVPFCNQTSKSGLLLPVIKLRNTVVKPHGTNHDELSEWLISGDLSMIGEQLTIVAQSLYILEPNQIPCERISQICATGLLAGIVQKQHTFHFSSHPINHDSKVEFEDLEWDDANICDRSSITAGAVTWFDIGVGLSRREENDPHEWLELRHAMVSMKCRRSTSDTKDNDRVLENLEPVTIVGQLMELNLETQEFFIQL